MKPWLILLVGGAVVLAAVFYLWPRGAVVGAGETGAGAEPPRRSLSPPNPSLAPPMYPEGVTPAEVNWGLPPPASPEEAEIRAIRGYTAF